MSMDPLVADLLLAEIRSARIQNRRRTGALSEPLIAVGLLGLAAAGWVLVFGRDHLAVFYAPSLLLISWIAGRRHRRAGVERGVVTPVLPWVLAAFGLLALSATVSRVGFATGHPLIEEVGPGLVFALGYLLLGVWGHNRPLVVAALLAALASLLSPLVATGDACVSAQLLTAGALLAGAGAANRSQRRTT